MFLSEFTQAKTHLKVVGWIARLMKIKTSPFDMNPRIL